MGKKPGNLIRKGRGDKLTLIRILNFQSKFYMKLLIIEDEVDLAKVLEEKFVNEGFQVVKIAHDGMEATSLIKSFRPDIILLDLLLPKKDGFQILEELKDDPELKHIPVIVLSNLGEDEEIKRALSLGAKDYYVKVQHPIKEIVEKVKAYAMRGK